MIAIEPVRIARGPAAGDEKALRLGLAAEVGAIAVAAPAALWNSLTTGMRAAVEKTL